jgi:hypothetical protein
MAHHEGHKDSMTEWWNSRLRRADLPTTTPCDVVEDLIMQSVHVAYHLNPLLKTIEKRRAKNKFSKQMIKTEKKELEHVKFWVEHENKVEARMRTFDDKHTHEACPNCSVRKAERARRRELAK